MAESEESNDRPLPESSPYAPPPVITEQPLPKVELPAFPLALVLISSVVAAVLTSIIGPLMFNGPSDYGAIALIASPFVMIAAFILVYMSVLGAVFPAGTPTIAWKLFVLAAVPPASMICFVPTCFGTGIMVLPILNTPGEWAFVVPLFFGYWSTLSLIAYRIRSHFGRIAARRYGTYLETNTTRSPFTS